jgi:hypothetical protein
MTKTLKDIFKEFEDKVESIHTLYSLGLMDSVSTRLSIVRDFSLIKRFIKAQPLENQRDLWNTMVDLLNASKAFDHVIKDLKAFDDEIKIRKDLLEIKEELMADCIKELENLNYTILQLHTQKNTVKGNAKKANKPDAKFNWQGKQTQLVYLIDQLYEHGFLSPISQPEKHRLTAQHFTVNGKKLNQKNLAKAKQSYLSNKGGKPKGAEKIDQIISAVQNQNPSKT